MDPVRSQLDSAYGRPARPPFPERPAEIRAALDGRLTRAAAFELRGTLAALASRRPRTLVLDLRTVSVLDASAVTSLRALDRRLAGAGGRLVVEAEGGVARTLDRLGAGHLLAPARA